MENPNWDKIVHVASSLVPKVNQYAMFIGRWQPLHESHQALFQEALNEGKNLLICIRDGEVNERNPFTPEEVKKNIENTYALLVSSGIMKVMIIPDIESVNFGRGVGYDIVEYVPPTEISDVSATKIREQMRKEGKL
jgi:nicotinamide mononucleotide adenylyltransferase